MNQQVTKHHFPRAHLWLLIPFILTVAGFYLSYWSKFTQAPFRQHVHGLSATAWYILLILQPWVYHNRSISTHRKLGLVGLLLAGGVVFSALQVIPFQIVSNLPTYLRYGFSFADFCALGGFSVSVIMAMYSSRDTSKHARWMISTAFWILLPATARLIFFPMVIAYDGNPPMTYIQVVYLCMAVTHIPLLIMMYFDYKKDAKIYKSYLFVLIGVTIYTISIVPIGEAPWWIDFCDSVIARGMN